MKCCVSTVVGTWTNWLIFEPEPDYSPDAGTGLLSPISYKRCYVEFYVRKIPRTYIHTYWYGPTLQRRMDLEWFYSITRRKNFVGGACAPPSAILVWRWIITTLKMSLKVIQTGTIQNLGCGFLFAFHTNYGRIFNRLWNIQRQRIAWPWNLG